MIRRYEDWGKVEAYLEDLARNFKPNGILSRIDHDEIDLAQDVDSVDLRKLGEGVVYFAVSSHPSALYRLNVDSVEGHPVANIWSSTQEEYGIVGPVDSVVSVKKLDRCSDEYLFEHGILRKGRLIAMPMFEYDGRNVRQPNEVWIGSMHFLRIKE